MTKARLMNDFRANPDYVVRNYLLPIGIKQTKQQLAPHLWLRVIKSVPKGSRLTKYTRSYFYGTSDSIKKCIGDVNDITYNEALREAQKMAKEYELYSDDKKEKNSLNSIFNEYMEFSSPSWKPATISKKEKMFKKLNHLAHTSISKIKFSQLTFIFDRLYKSQKYDALRDFWDFCHALFRFAFIRKYTKMNLFDGLQVTDIYRFPRVRVCMVGSTKKLT